ncbi:MAG: amidohydrolase family protein [Oscillospiraceae bacterium]|nr:amidohydrolase family protein [Oscillospiraceae bacterium]
MIYECHGHIILDANSYQNSISRHETNVDEAFIRRNLQACQDHGVIFYRDGGDKHMASVFARKVAHEYGIDYRTPAYIIHKNGYYGHMFGRGFDNLAEYRQLVRVAGVLGADFIKLTASGFIRYSDGGVTGPPTCDEFSEMVKIAHGEGFAVMVHANGADNIKRALDAGADSIEHGFYMDRAACLIMAQTGAVWVPTIATVANLIGIGHEHDSVLRQVYEGHQSALVEANALGVTIACGSDAGAQRVYQGQGACDEQHILSALGINTAPGNLRISEVFRRQ